MLYKLHILAEIAPLLTDGGFSFRVEPDLKNKTKPAPPKRHQTKKEKDGSNAQNKNRKRRNCKGQ